MSNPIPVGEAKRLQESSDCDFVIVFGWNNNNSTECATFGRTPKDKDSAAAMYKWIIKQMRGDPSSIQVHDDQRAKNAAALAQRPDPAKVKAAREAVEYLRDEIRHGLELEGRAYDPFAAILAVFPPE